MSDLDDDYKNIRRNLYDLASQGDEAIELMMVGQLIKQNAEIGEKIMKLQKSKKEVTLMDDDKKALPGTVTNNNVFIGSTTDLQRMLQDEQVIEHGDEET